MFLDIYDLSKLSQLQELIKKVPFSGEWMQAFRDGQLNKFCSLDYIASLRQYQVLLLAIHGEKDMGFPVSVANRLKHDVPHCHLSIIPNAVHFIYIDKPVHWLRHLKDFLQL